MVHTVNVDVTNNTDETLTMKKTITGVTGTWADPSNTVITAHNAAPQQKISGASGITGEFIFEFTDVNGSAKFGVEFPVGNTPKFSVESTLNRRKITLSFDKDGVIMACKVEVSHT